MKAIFFEAMAGKEPELVDIPEKDGILDYGWMENKIGYGCNMLDSTLRCVGERTYRFWVDDLGIDNAKRITAYGSEYCWLFGNMFIFRKEDKKGNLVEPTQGDVEFLKQHIGQFFESHMPVDLAHPTASWTAAELARLLFGGGDHEEK